MKKKKQWILALALIIILVFLLTVLSEIPISAEMLNGSPEVYPLEGLKGVTVKVVYPFSAFQSRPGLDPINIEDLQEIAESTLNKVGIKVFESSSRNPEIAELHITINTLKMKFSSEFILQLKTELYQSANLDRNPACCFLTPTWPDNRTNPKAEMVVVSQRKTATQLVENEIHQQILLFANDYFSANPKPEDFSTGTIKYLDLEGGFYGIISDSGQKYKPINLPRKYRKNGLRVAFRAREKKGMVSIHMWGKIVEITHINEL